MMERASERGRGVSACDPVLIVVWIRWPLQVVREIANWLRCRITHARNGTARPDRQDYRPAVTASLPNLAPRPRHGWTATHGHRPRSGGRWMVTSGGSGATACGHDTTPVAPNRTPE